MGLLSGIFKARDKPKDATAGSGWRFWFGKTPSNEFVNERTSMQVAAVYACVRVLSEAVAQLPLHLYKYDGEGKKMAYDHPLYTILHDEPNPEMSSFSFRETLMSHLLLWGNAYAQIVRNGKGEVIGLYPLMPTRMRVDRDENHNLYYEYTICDDEAKPIKKQILKPSEVFHIPGLGFDGLVGYSPIAIAKNTIGLTMATEEYGAKFFANGATPGGILEYPGVIKDIDKVRDDWNNGFSGAENSSRVAILEEGMKYTPISINPDEAQFLDTRKFQIDEIARIFRVPPHMIGDLEHSTFSNIEEQSLEFVTYSLQPWLVRWEQAIERSLFRKNEKGKYFAKFNVDGLLRGNYKSRMDGYAVGIQNGFMSPNDVRRLEDMDLIPDELGGNNYMCNGNMINIGDVGKQYDLGEEGSDDEEVLEMGNQDGESGQKRTGREAGRRSGDRSGNGTADGT
ncbi:MAG: phage portal protein [Bacteroidales bacterium]|nr:phage portal protein [Bacteroidales bacterium]